MVARTYLDWKEKKKILLPWSHKITCITGSNQFSGRAIHVKFQVDMMVSGIVTRDLAESESLGANTAQIRHYIVYRLHDVASYNTTVE